MSRFSFWRARKGGCGLVRWFQSPGTTDDHTRQLLQRKQGFLVIKWLIAGVVSFLLTFLWALMKSASDADDAMERESRAAAEADERRRIVAADRILEGC